MHWLRRGEPETSSVPANLDPIQIFTGELELDGFVAPTGQRITDMLLRGQDLAFLPRGADPAPDQWIWISATDILLVIPPPLPARPDWTASRQMRRVFMRVGEYRVIGSAHLPPGTELDRGLADRLPFLPLTSASVARSGEIEPRDAEVVIVNLGRSAEQRIIGDSDG